MLAKRIIPCLDIRNGKTVKGINFENVVDVGDPVEMGAKYARDGADELVFYDITASHEKRGIMIDVVRKVAEQIFIPFSVGGGISTLDDIKDVILAGAEKVSVNSSAVKNPSVIEEGASQCGFCTPGMILTAKALLDSHPSPTADEVKGFIAGNLCRCTGYDNIVRAILKAADQ